MKIFLSFFSFHITALPYNSLSFTNQQLALSSPCISTDPIPQVASILLEVAGGGVLSFFTSAFLSLIFLSGSERPDSPGVDMKVLCLVVLLRVGPRRDLFVRCRTLPPSDLLCKVPGVKSVAVSRIGSL